jgi:predicted amidohydrolase YtcJ
VTADWILTGGRVQTFDAAGSVAEAVAVADGRFVAVGTRAQIEALAGAGTRRTDLDGGTLYPGFCDTHMHLEKVARELAMLQLGDARSHADVLAAVERAARTSPAGEWIRSFGDDGAWHERQLAEGEMPSREALDRAAPEHPVFLYRRPDAAALNSRAAELLGAVLEREVWDARTGLLSSPNTRYIEAKLPRATPERELELLGAACVQLMRMGITSVVDPGLPAAFANTWDLYTRARLPVRVYLMNRFDYHRSFEEEFARLRAERVRPLDGDEHLRAFAVKLLLDGEFDNAWVRDGEPLNGEPLRRYEAKELEAVVGLCAAAGWPLCTHAMGGGAISFLIDAVRDAGARRLRFEPGQVTIAHAFLPSREDLEACRELGIGLSVHPLLAYVFEHEMQDAWGPLAQRSNPLRTMLELGVRVAGGSDVIPCEPLRNARVAVTRTSRDGAVFGPDEAIAPRKALTLFTRSAGEYVGRPDLGVVGPGAAADFVVWSADPLETPVEDWLDLEVRLAVVAGETTLPA